MNTRLKILYEKYKLSQKNIHEINQIYNFLSDDKKNDLIKNFDNYIFKIKRIEDSIETEKNILIWDAVERVRNAILEKRKVKIDEKIRDEINLLKGEI